MIRVGIIGYGYWGPNLVRNFSEAPDSTVIAVSDLRDERLNTLQNRHPMVKATKDYRELISDPAIDAIVIATPVSSHFQLALEAIRAGKHVLVEKPMTATSEQGIRLVEEAEKFKRVLMVDHTFVFMGAVAKIKDLIASRELGEIYYYDSTRVNLGLFQSDVNVVWDLAVHDLSIMDHILGARPTAVLGAGMSHVANSPENVAYLTLFFDSMLIAHINVNWLSPVKLRQTLIGGSQKMIVFDDLHPNEKIRIYDRGIEVSNGPESVYNLLVNYRAGDMWAPQYNRTEALKVEVQHFIDCIENGKRPITDGTMGLRMVEILEAATLSLRNQGRLTEIKYRC